VEILCGMLLAVVEEIVVGKSIGGLCRVSSLRKSAGGRSVECRWGNLLGVVVKIVLEKIAGVRV